MGGSATVKARVVGEDERELGVRALLNLGHTIGHAIEFASPLSHGESVGIGLVAAARISEIRLGFEEANRIVGVHRGPRPAGQGDRPGSDPGDRPASPRQEARRRGNSDGAVAGRSVPAVPDMSTGTTSISGLRP